MSEENKREDEPVERSAPETQTSAESAPEAVAEQPAKTVTEPKAAESSPDAPATPAQSPAEPPGEPSAAPAVGEGEAAAPARRKETDEEKAARRKAALEAREAAKAAAAQAAAQAAQSGNAAPAAASGEGAEAEAQPPKPPSPNQPRLDRVAALLRELVSADAVEEAYINEANDHLPTLVVKNELWEQAARLFHDHADLECKYLRNVSGVDYETYMEVVYYPLNLNTRDCYCVKVKTDREKPSVASVTPIWETANWNEREIYDLLGIEFPGHPNLTRIMMPDDWVGHPLRKDYVPLDPEV